MSRDRTNKGVGYYEAHSLGYTIYSHSGCHKRYTYMKTFGDGVTIELEATLTQEEAVQYILSGIYDHLIQCRIGPFSLPNNNFPVFEKKLRKCLLGGSRVIQL